MMSYDVEKISTSVTLCNGKPPVVGGFPSQRANNAGVEFSEFNLNKLLNK